MTDYKTTIIIDNGDANMNLQINNILREQLYDSLSINTYLNGNGYTVERVEVCVQDKTKRIHVKKNDGSCLLCG